MIESELDILYRDEDYVVVDKPSGILIHKTNLSTDKITLMTLLRDQIGQYVYPVHRLDRPTSGVVLFALSPDAAAKACALFEKNEIQKTYHAVVRGWTKDEGIINKPVRESPDHPYQDAITNFRLISKIEFPDKVSLKHESSRYSLVEVKPVTGRYHQIRKHFQSISHHIIGDTAYGEGRHNRFFREKFGVNRLLLSASILEFFHPKSGKKIQILTKNCQVFSKIFNDFEVGKKTHSNNT